MIIARFYQIACKNPYCFDKLTLPWHIAVNNFVYVACANFNSIALIRFPMIVYVCLYVYVYDRLHTASLGRMCGDEEAEQPGGLVYV